MGSRVLVELKSLSNVDARNIYKHSIQSLVYSIIKQNDKFKDYHNKKGFKFFTFSDLWPAKKLNEGDKAYFILSSPMDDLIRAFENNLPKEVTIGGYPFNASCKRVKQRFQVCWETGSPILLYRDNKKGEYLVIEKDGINMFLWRLEENAIKKFEAYYGYKPELSGPIFDILIPRRTVVIINKKGGNRFLMFASKWRLLFKETLSTPDERKFYEFLYYCGLGEKNSMGFGLVNVVKSKALLL